MFYRYLKKQKLDFLESSTFNTPKQMIVVVPCYDEPNIINLINSLTNCATPTCNVGIILAFNTTIGNPPEIEEQNLRSIQEIQAIDKFQIPSWIEIQCINIKPFPQKWGGVGWARKIGMDCAIDHFAKTNNHHGIIISLDADAHVQTNYFTAIEESFSQHKSWSGATLSFKHETESTLFDDQVKISATYYELYMRYYKLAIQSTGHPHAIYTIGSCFACRADAYVKQGGMNRKKAGEDFYFLHKLTQVGDVGEIRDTTIYLSIRPSDRVPFGTGPAIRKGVSDTTTVTMTYPFQQFAVLQDLFNEIENVWLHTEIEYSNFHDKIHPKLIDFMIDINFIESCTEIRNNCSSYQAFKKRFFQLFNAFTILKWLNYSTSHFPKALLSNEILSLFNVHNLHQQIVNNKPQSMLTLIRELESTGKFDYIRKRQ